MARGYSYLTDETKSVLTDNVKVLAREWHQTPRFINQILGEERGDPFAPFVEMFDAAVHGGLPVCFWINRLESSRLRYAPIVSLKEPIECLMEQVDASSGLIKDFSRFLSDGNLTLDEIKLLEARIDNLERTLEKTKVSLGFQRGVLENSGGRLSRIKPR